MTWYERCVGSAAVSAAVNQRHAGLIAQHIRGERRRLGGDGRAADNVVVQSHHLEVQGPRATEPVLVRGCLGMPQRSGYSMVH